MAQRFIIVGFALSKPGTMGGNTKIALEVVRHLSLSREVHMVLPEDRVETVVRNIGAPKGMHLHIVRPFARGDFRHPIASARHYAKALGEEFLKLNVCSDDTVYSCSDFHVDTLPCYWLKKRFAYKWIAVQFLFVPFLLENVFRGYQFPALKYVLVWMYSYMLFYLARMRADAFVITNDSDRRHFAKSFQDRVFAFYGGVNVDQIPSGDVTKTRDVVFCSRLHPQKGIDGFLDVWKIVRDSGSTARLAVIGNGEPVYEQRLRKKAVRLGVADSVDWLGYVNNEAKYAVYRSARVMVHPTVFDNNGMVAAEALCSGLPVVMYDLPALRHVYTTGCVKVPFGDKKAFAEEVVKLLSDERYRAVVAPKEQEICSLRAYWDWPHRVSRFVKWLEKLHG